MAAYPPGPSRLFQLPDLAGGQAPGDLAYLVDVSLGTAAGDPSDVKSTLNDLFAEITKNITDLTVQFGNGVTGTVSAAGKGKIRYNDTAKSFQVSEDGGAYQNLLKGSGTATRVAFWSAADELSSDAAFYWQNTDKRLGIGVGTTPGAPIDVLAESVSSIAQQWRPNSGSMRAAIKLDGGPETFFGTTTAHNLHLITTDIQRLSIEATSGNVGINKITAIAAQLQVVANAATTKGLIVNSAPSTSVNLVEFYNDAALRYVFGNDGTLTLGLAGASGATGQLVFSVNGQANTQTLRAGTAPAASNTYLWPSANPTAGQALTASAPSGGNVTLSWTSVVTGPASPVNSVQFNNAGAFGGSSNFLWDDSNRRLLLGVTVVNGTAPIDVLADSGTVAQQWRPNTGTPRVQMQVNNSEGIVGTSTLNRFHLMSNNAIRMTLEDTGAVGVNQQVPAAQFHVVGAAAGSLTMIVATAPSPSANIAEFRNDSSNRFVFGNSGILTLGLASTATGRVTFAVAGSANTQSLQGADTPAATNIFKWPSADPTVGQVLTASAPAAGVVTLSWSTAGGGTTINPTDGVMPVRSNATTFIDSPLSVASSAVTMTRSAIGVTSSDGIILLNATAAAAGAQQYSPRLRFTGQGWKTTAVAASQTVDWLIELQPVQGTANPNSVLAFASQINGAGFTGNSLLQLRTIDATTGSNGSIVITALSPNTQSLTIAPRGIIAGPSYQANAGSHTFQVTNIAVTSTIAEQVGLCATTSGTPAAGFGPSLGFETKTNNNARRAIGYIANILTDAADATRTSAYDFQVVTSAALGIIARMSASSLLYLSTGQIGFSTAPATTANNVGLANSATGVFRITDGSTGLGSILIGTSTDSLTGNFTVMASNAATNTIVTVARLGVNSTGTAASGFGAALSWSAETSTTNDTESGRDNCYWASATHASRTSARSWSLVNNATLVDVMALIAPAASSPYALTLYNGTLPNVWTSGSFVAKLYLIDGTLPATGIAAHFSATGADAPAWQLLRGRGTNASPTAVQNADRLGLLQFAGQTSTTTNSFAVGAEIRVSASENWSVGANGCAMVFRVSNNGATITERMTLAETGTLRIGASAGNYNTTTLVQVGNYASWNTDVVTAIYTGANGTKGLQVIGTNGATANLIEVYRDSLTPNLLTLAASGVLSLRTGLNTGTSTVKVGGTYFTDLTPVSNSGSGETDLMSVSIGNNRLGTDDDFIEFDAWGEIVSPSGNVTLKAYCGATVIFNTGSQGFSSGAWRLRGKVFRGSGTTQVTVTTFDGETTILANETQVAAPGETLSGSVTLKFTAQASASDEVFQEGLTAQWHPAAT